MNTYFRLFFLIYSFNCNTPAFSLIKQLLKSSPKIDTSDTWSRPVPNVSIYGSLSLSLKKSLNVPTPSYVQILADRILSVTSFSLLRKGCIMHFDLSNTSKCHTMRGEYLWPNELAIFKDRFDHTVMLIPDGFLLPGQCDGGLYAVRDPHLPNSTPIRITQHKKGWFYHRATHVTLPGGQQGILTARAKKSILREGEGELVWLSIPSCISEGTYWKKQKKPIPSSQSMWGYLTGLLNNPQEELLWPEVVLASGPDVMFEVFDRDRNDNAIDVIAAHFFSSALSVFSLMATPEPPFVKVIQTSSLDIVGKPYGLCLAKLTPNDVEPANDEAQSKIPFLKESAEVGDFKLKHKKDSGFVRERSSKSKHKQNKVASEVRGVALDFPTMTHPLPAEGDDAPTHVLVTTHECSYDFISTVKMIFETISGRYPRVRTGGRGIRAWDRTSVESGAFAASVDKGGGLYAFEIPKTPPLTAPDGLVAKLDYGNTQNTRKRRKKSLDRLNMMGRNHIFSNRNTYPDVDKLHTTGFSYSHSSASLEPRDLSSFPTSVESNGHDILPRTTPQDQSWVRHTLFRGFKVRGWGGIFSPGAPGFPYVFQMPNKPNSAPLILLAGDCTGSAYVFTPTLSLSGGVETTVPSYQLAFEVECGATVGSAAVAATPDGSGDVEIFIPSYELNQIHVFRLSENSDGVYPPDNII